jgi:predicted NBD/HSP70 family sugar kinase
MLTLGTGVGGGVVIDGRIFRGATGLGAELGHVVVNAHGPDCPGKCPNRGCLEAYCSGTALGRAATSFVHGHPDSQLATATDADGNVSGVEVVRLAREGDDDASRLLTDLGTWLGVGIASFVNVFEPEHIVIGGGLSAAAPPREKPNPPPPPTPLQSFSWTLLRAGILHLPHPLGAQKSPRTANPWASYSISVSVLSSR